MATANKQELTKKTTNNNMAKKQPQTIKDYVKVMEGEIAKALPSVMTPERFTRITLSAISNTPKLAQCTPQSFLAAMMNAAQLGLEPNTPLGEAYLIPYGKQVQFQIGYKGLLNLAHRSGTNVEVHEVYENDEFEYSYGLNPNLVHKPAMKDRGKIICYYAVWRNEGAYGFEVMSREDVERHGKKYSKTYSNGPWQTDFDAMAKKTVLKQALKYAPLSVEFARQISEDETIKTEIKEDMAEVPNEFYEAEYEEVFDAETGEVINE